MLWVAVPGHHVFSHLLAQQQRLSFHFRSTKSSKSDGRRLNITLAELDGAIGSLMSTTLCIRPKPAGPDVRSIRLASEFNVYRFRQKQRRA